MTKRFEDSLPLLKGEDTVLLHDGGKCFVCRENLVGEPNSFALINGGGLLRKESGNWISEKISGFLTFTWHGAHSDMNGVGVDSDISASYDLVNDTNHGQFDMMFCSTPCMRSFLNTCVDELEALIEEEKKKKR